MQAVDLDVGAPDASLFAFKPNANRAHLVEARVRAGLADSLAAALRALGNETAAAGEDLIARVRAGAISPVVFGAYTELVEAIFSEDIDAAVKIAGELCAPDFGRAGEFRIVTLTDSHLGEGQTARYRCLVDDDPEVGIALRALPQRELDSAFERVKEAVALLDAATPELAGELRTLVHEIVVVESPATGPSARRAFSFGARCLSS